jgi:nucleoside-diphosphate-sugar epimerase
MPRGAVIAFLAPTYTIPRRQERNAPPADGGDENMKVLVTGGTGFTGSHLVRRLLGRGHEVVALDNQKGLFWDDLEREGATMVLGSVADGDLLKSAARGCRVVYHLAAAFRKINLPKEVYREINEGGTRNAIEAGLAGGMEKFVYCSTQGVHGHVDDPPGSEETPVRPEDYYQETKYLGEIATREYVEKGLDATILRPMAIYGPGDPERFFMLFRQVKKGWFPIFGDGSAFYHPLYIDNFIDSFELAAEKPEARGQTYLIGDEHYYPIKELVKKVAQAMGIDVRIIHLPFRPMWLAAVLCESVCTPLKISPPLFRRRVDWYRQVRAFSIDKARNELGYRPAVGIDEGLARTYRWYLDNGYL